MLSIQISAEHEWWVSGEVFDRLFASALDQGVIDHSLAEWQHVANANGGLSFKDLEPDVATALTSALRATASMELQRLCATSTDPAETSYRLALERLLSIISNA